MAHGSRQPRLTLATRRTRPRLQLEYLESRLAPATHTWTGAVSNLWSNNNNWIGGAPPADVTSDLIFPAVAANRSNVNDIVGLFIQSITYSGSGYATTGSDVNVPGGQTAGTITLDANVTGADVFNPNIILNPPGLTLTVTNATASLTLGGMLITPNPMIVTLLVLNGAGTTLLSGNNTYAGQTTLQSGTLVLGSNTALGMSAFLISGGTIQADATPRVLPNNLSINGNFTVGGTSNLTFMGPTTLATMRVNAAVTINVTNTGLTTFTGTLSDLGPSFTSGLTKAGPGILVLSGSGFYAGPTVVAAGVLQVDGTLPSSDVTVNANAVLRGSGIVRTITASGTVAPGGPSTGVLQSGNATFTAGSTFLVRLNGPIPGSGFDQLNSAGIVDLSAGPLLNVNPGFAAPPASSFPILVGSSGIRGTFTGLANNSLANFGGQVFQVSYTPNTVVLTRTTTMAVVTVTATANPSVFGQPVTFMATVASGPPGLGTPTGTVQFQADGMNVGSPVTLTGGVAATSPLTNLAVGSHTITAVYSGDSNFVSATGSLTDVINRAATTVTLSSSLNPAVLGQAITFTATIMVQSPGSGLPGGGVQFQVDGNNIGNPVPVNNAGGMVVASFSSATLTVGSHTVTASYAGDPSFLGAISAPLTEVVNRGSTTTTVSATPNPVVYGLPVQLTAVVRGVPPSSGTPTGTVAFLDGLRPLGIATLDATGTAVLTTALLLGGNRFVTASYMGDASFVGSTSSPLTETVTSSHNQAYVVALYRTVLERAPDPTGYVFWTQQLDAGLPRAVVALAFEKSTEHLGLEVDSFYQTILHHPADPTGRALWVNALANGQSEAMVVVAFLTSPEYTASHPDNASFIGGLDQAILQRSSVDPTGLAAWQSALQSGQSRAQLALAFLSSAEAYGLALNFYYTNYLGRAADPAGVQSLLTALQNSQFTPTGISTLFLASDEFFQRAIQMGGG